MKQLYAKAFLSLISALFIWLLLCQFSNAQLTMLADNAESAAQPPAQSAPLRPIRSSNNTSLVYDLIYAYCWGGQNAWDHAQPKLEKISANNEVDGQNWKEILQYWDYVDYDMDLIDNILPDGLNDANSLCLVVLGYELKPDGSPKQELIGRLEVALQCAEKYPNARILCSGGVTLPNGYAEASVMAQWLIDHGVDSERIILEKKSKITVENVQFSLNLLSQEHPDITDIAIISSDYHVRIASVFFKTKIVLDGLPISLVSHATYPTNKRDLRIRQVQMEGILSLAKLSAS